MTASASTLHEKNGVRAVLRLLRGGLTLAGLAGVAAVGAAMFPQGAAGQEAPSVRFHVTAEAGASLQDSFDGIRFGRDLRSYALRLTAARRDGLHPWIDGARFTRPDLECLSGLDCTDAGWLTRAGIAVPLSRGGGGPGVGVEARTGLGAGFADETSLSYLVGFALLWRGLPRVDPLVEFRWEHVTGMNITMLAAGIRLHL